jgi:2-polyprenyl-3-methyl-5-hydroxy-6-metoxy-1,4-benzoquinol methylase
MNHYVQFGRTGQPLRFHDQLDGAEWGVYERGQIAQARLIAPELVRRLRVPPTATALLDIGGGHGLYSAELCKRHSQLRATILDLPGAIATRADQCSLTGVASRMEFRTGNALTDDFGCEVYDIVLLANVVHHFSFESMSA